MYFLYFVSLHKAYTLGVGIAFYSYVCEEMMLRDANISDHLSSTTTSIRSFENEYTAETISIEEKIDFIWYWLRDGFGFSFIPITHTTFLINEVISYIYSHSETKCSHCLWHHIRLWYNGYIALVWKSDLCQWFQFHSTIYRVYPHHFYLSNFKYVKWSEAKVLKIILHYMKW